MAYIRKSDGTRKRVTKEDIWGPEPTAAERALIARQALEPVTRTQFAIALAASGVITAEDAVNFAGGNSLPAFAEAAISNSGLSGVEQMAAKVKALSVLNIHRDNPIVALMRDAKGLTDLQVDDLFRAAVGIE